MWQWFNLSGQRYNIRWPDNFFNIQVFLVLFALAPDHSHLINPQLANNDVVNCGGNLLPCVVIAALLKNGMDSACERKYTQQKEKLSVLKQHRVIDSTFEKKTTGVSETFS